MDRIPEMCQAHGHFLLSLSFRPFHIWEVGLQTRHTRHMRNRATMSMSHSLRHRLPTLLYNSGYYYVKILESNLTMLMKCPHSDVNCMYSRYSTVIASERTGWKPSSSGLHPCKGLKQRVSHGTCESTAGTFTVTYTVVIRLPSLAKGGLETGPWWWNRKF
jgi:hypothetical protein